MGKVHSQQWVPVWDIVQRKLQGRIKRVPTQPAIQDVQDCSNHDSSLKSNKQQLLKISIWHEFGGKISLEISIWNEFYEGAFRNLCLTTVISKTPWPFGSDIDTFNKNLRSWPQLLETHGLVWFGLVVDISSTGSQGYTHCPSRRSSSSDPFLYKIWQEAYHLQACTTPHQPLKYSFSSQDLKIPQPCKSQTASLDNTLGGLRWSYLDPEVSSLTCER